MSGFMGAGDVFVRRTNDDGTQGPWLKMGNVPVFSIQPQGKTVSRVSTSYETYGQVLGSVGLPEPSKLIISSDELNPVNVGLALQGIVETIAASAGSDTETITVAMGDMVKLKHQDVSSVEIIGNHVEGKDYRLFAGAGMLEILPSGNIADGTSISVAYDYGTKAGYRILGSRVASITAEIMLDGRNLETGESVVVTIDKAILQSKKEMPFISGDQKFVTMQLEGQMQTLPSKKEPFTVTVRG